jgi:hypothetical protein
VAANISVAGDNLGAIVVGDHNTVVINQPAGAVLLPAQPVRTTRREGAVKLGPRPFPGLIDRQDEEGELRGALAAVPPRSIDVSGPPGIGKTALLRHLCGDEIAIAAEFPDGVVYLDTTRASTGDILQQLFDAFFETDRPFKPDETQLRRFLARTSPLVMLDGYCAAAAEFDRLLNLASTATFALSGPQRILLGEGSAVTLAGLRSGDALALMSRELERSIDDTEVMAARAICAALDGNPLNIILASAHSRVYGVPLAQLAGDVRSAESPEEWLKGLIESKLSERDRRALAAFAAVDCAPLADSEVGAIGGTEAEAALEGLRDRRLIAFDGKRSRVRIGIAATLAMSFLGLLPAEAAAHAFLEIAAHEPANLLVAHSDAIVGALKHAALSGKCSDVLALAHRAGDAVALSGRWDCWHEMLEHALSAAKAGHDLAGEAWALHQIGSSALATGNVAAAQTALQAAAHIRAGLGDPVGAAVTQHNLDVLALKFGSQARPGHVEAGARKWGLATKIAVGAAFFVAVGSLGAWVTAGPSVSLEAERPHIAAGQSTKLCYKASHVSNVRINGVAATNGCVDVHPNQTTTYRIDARGPLGLSLSRSVVVSVAAAPSAAPKPQEEAPGINTPTPRTHEPLPVSPPPEYPPSGTARSNVPVPTQTLVFPPGHSASSAPTSVPTTVAGCNSTSGRKTDGYAPYPGAAVARSTYAPKCGSNNQSQSSSNGGSSNGCNSKGSTGTQYVAYAEAVAPKPTCKPSASTPAQGQKQGLIPVYHETTVTLKESNSSAVGTRHLPASEIPQGFSSPSGYSHVSSPYSQPRPLYSAPRSLYSAPRPLYSAPRSLYQEPRPVYSHPASNGAPSRQVPVVNSRVQPRPRPSPVYPPN